jgi:hypothetical protein
VRKWIVIAVLVLVAAGIAWLLFRTWETSVEYHKRRYAAACSGYTVIDMGRYGWAALCGRAPDVQGQDDRRARRIAVHERALIKAGYLEERAFVVSDPRTELVMRKAIGAWPAKFPTNNVSVHSFYTNIFILGGRERGVIARTYRQRTNAFVIVAPRDEMQVWEKLVSEADQWPVVKSE